MSDDEDDDEEECGKEEHEKEAIAEAIFQYEEGEEGQEAVEAPIAPPEEEEEDDEESGTWRILDRNVEISWSNREILLGTSLIFSLVGTRFIHWPSP